MIPCEWDFWRNPLLHGPTTSLGRAAQRGGEAYIFARSSCYSCLPLEIASTKEQENENDRERQAEQQPKHGILYLSQSQSVDAFHRGIPQ